MQIKPLEERNDIIINQLTDIWQSSVIATHDFLSSADIAELTPQVREYLKSIETLHCYYDKNGSIQGFLGMEGKKIEMLFIPADCIGKGIGKALLNYAITNLGAIYVDVNEQNDKATGFYLHMGFRVISRSELDGQGRPFPILHLGL